MRFRNLLALLLPLAVVGPAVAQGTGQGPVLSPGDPPLTQSMADDYMRFMQWALRTPLTLAQRKRITDYLLTNWKSGDKPEINRTLAILELRNQFSNMKLTDNPWAAYETGQDALHYWKANPSTEMAVWGQALFKSSHTPVVQDTPSLTRQMEDAYEELGYFMMNEVDGAHPTPLDAVERVQLDDGLANSYKSLPSDQKQNFALLPKVWVQIRDAWPALDDASKAAFRADWKAHFFPQAEKPKTSSTKQGSKSATKISTEPAPPNESPLIRLTKMQWVLHSDVFSKLSGTGTPYGSGW